MSRLLLLLLLCSFSAASGQSVSGRITDEGGQALAYAALLVTPGNHSSITNEQGRYELRLPAGDYEIQVHFIGYQRLRQRFTVGSGTTKLDLQLTRQVFELSEVKVKASGEDPAYDMLREAIQKAPLHRLSVSGYSAKSYVKGSFRVSKAPWAVRKLLENEKMKVGTTYVMESVSQINYKQPATFSEKVLSMRSSLPPSVDARVSYGTFNFYNSRVGDLSSPLAPGAFKVYRYKFEGSRQEGDERIVKIKVTPRQSGPGVVSGDLYLVYGSWSIHSLDFRFVDDGRPTRVEQLYQPLDGLWMPTKLDMTIDIGYMGAEATVRYLTSVRDYRITPNASIAERLKKKEALPPDVDNKQARTAARSRVKELEKQRKDTLPDDAPTFDYRYEVDTLARLTSESLWDELRQLPLDTAEIKGYQIADSLYADEYRKQKADTVPPKFGWDSPISGYSRRYGRPIEDRLYPLYWRYDGLITGIFPDFDFYNATEGFVLKTGIEREAIRSRRNRSISRLDVRYSFGRQRLTGTLRHEERRPDMRWTLEAGSRMRQLNPSEPIHPFMNTLYTLIDSRHLMPLYESQGLWGYYNQRLNARNSFELSAAAEYRFDPGLASRLWFFPDNTRFVRNIPLNVEAAAFDAHAAFRLEYGWYWRPWAKIGLRNGEEVVTNGGKPSFRLGGVSGYARDFYQEVQVRIEQRAALGEGREFDYQLTVGGFVQAPRYLVDLHHFDGNQTLFMGNDFFRFRALDYYAYSTGQRYVQFFSGYTARRLLFTQFETLRLLGIEEHLFLNAMATPRHSYMEAGYRIDGFFQLFGIDLFGGISPAHAPTYGLRLKVGI